MELTPEITTEIKRATDPIYKKVSKVIPEIEWSFHAPLIHKINMLKKEKNAVVLAHNYQTPEIFHGIADIAADSLALAVEAEKTNADIIVVCGVHFMAETAKLMNPKKKILLPDMEAGCSLASSITGKDVKMLKEKYPSVPVVTYVNTSAEVKAESDMKKLLHAKLANLNAARMCNHKRTIPKNFEQSLQKKKDTLKNVQQSTPWQKSEESLKKAESIAQKTKKQKERIKKIKIQIKNKKRKHDERIEKLKLQIELTQKTRDHNLGTSLRNYIDPRIFKTWTDEVVAEWEKLYTSALQKKFLWVKSVNSEWNEISKQY